MLREAADQYFGIEKNNQVSGEIEAFVNTLEKDLKKLGLKSIKWYSLGLPTSHIFHVEKNSEFPLAAYFEILGPYPAL